MIVPNPGRRERRGFVASPFFYNMKRLKVGQKFYAKNSTGWWIKILKIEDDGRYYCLMTASKGANLPMRSVKDSVSYEYINGSYLIK